MNAIVKCLTKLRLCKFRKAQVSQRISFRNCKLRTLRFSKVVAETHVFSIKNLWVRLAAQGSLKNYTGTAIAGTYTAISV